MERKVGTVSRGIRCPIIRQGDDLANIVVTSVLEAAEQEGFQLRDQDVIAVTESIVARAQGNYVSVDDIAADVRAKLGGEYEHLIGTVRNVGYRFDPPEGEGDKSLAAPTASDDTDANAQ